MKNFFAAIARAIAYCAQYAAHAAVNAGRLAAGLCEIPFQFIDSMMNGGGDEAPQLPQPVTQPAQATQATQQLREAIDGLLDLEKEVAKDPRALIYMYAVAHPELREAMDLTTLDQRLHRWLISLTGDEYKAIKKAGLQATIAHLDGVAPLDGVLPAPEQEADSRTAMTTTVRKNLRDRLSKMGMPNEMDGPSMHPNLRAA